MFLCSRMRNEKGISIDLPRKDVRKKWVSRGMEERIWGNGPLHCTPLPPIISYTKMLCESAFSLSLSSSLFHFLSLFIRVSSPTQLSLFSMLCCQNHVSHSKLVSPTTPFPLNPPPHPRVLRSHNNLSLPHIYGKFLTLSLTSSPIPFILSCWTF